MVPHHHTKRATWQLLLQLTVTCVWGVQAAQLALEKAVERLREGGLVSHGYVFSRRVRSEETAEEKSPVATVLHSVSG